MNAKKAKMLRRAARDIAIGSSLPSETKYAEQRNGNIRVERCDRAVLKQVKRMHTKGIPSTVFDDLATNAIVGQ